MGIFNEQIEDGTIVEGKLDAAAQTKLNAGEGPWSIVAKGVQALGLIG